MFPTVRRRLVLLNVGLVGMAIIVVVVGIYLLLQAALQQEADAAMSERIRVAETVWSQQVVAGLEPLPSTPPAPREDRDELDDDGEESDDGTHEALETGDTLIFVFDRDGRLVGNERDVESGQLPVVAVVPDALFGETDRQTLDIDGERIRVQTAPMMIDGEIVGAIQAVRSDREHLAELELVRNVGVAGLVLGVLVAIPAGMLLSRRAMLPLSLAFERQRHFVAEASHELKTPLSVIRANVELITREPTMPEAERQAELGHVLAEIDDMSRMVGAMLSLARLDASSGSPGDRNALLDCARKLVDEMQPLAVAAGIRLTVSGHAVEVLADEGSVRQILRILLDNAIAYTPTGGQVDVLVYENRQQGVMQVRDTGIGIPLEDQAHVFDRFYRAEHSRYQQPGGAGLGLAIARASVTALGGSIRLESSPGHGTTFVVTLPKARRA